MKNIKIINRLIITKIVEIILVATFTIASLPIYKKNSNLLPSISKKELTYTNLYIENEFDYCMYPISKTEALNSLYPIKLTIKNESLTEEAYILVLKISKESTLNFNCLDIAINDEVKPLHALNKWEDINNYYFEIASESLKGENKEYFIKVWLDEKSNNEMQYKKIFLTFELMKSTTRI